MWTINHGTYYKLNISLFYQDVIAFPSVSYNLFKSSLQTISSCIYYIITIKFDMAKIKSFPTFLNILLPSEICKIMKVKWNTNII